MKTPLQLLNEAIRAKIAYWDAMRDLEQAMCGADDGWSDKGDNAIGEFVDVMAAGCGDDMNPATQSQFDELNVLNQEGY